MWLFKKKKEHFHNFEELSSISDSNKKDTVQTSNENDIPTEESISNNIESFNSPNEYSSDSHSPELPKGKSLDSEDNNLSWSWNTSDNVIEEKKILIASPSPVKEKKKENVVVPPENKNRKPSSKNKKTIISGIRSNPKVQNFLNKSSDEINVYVSKIDKYLKKKWIFLTKKFVIYHLRESITSIIILLLCLFWLYQALLTLRAQDDLPLIKELYELKRDIKIEDEKIKENKKAEYYADILRFWVKTEYWRYPENWFLESFKQIFPDNLSDLQLLTFIEWWWSEFIDYDGKKIRQDNNLIKTFEQDSRPVDTWLVKWYNFRIELEWDPEKVDSLLYNIKYANKIPKNFTDIKKVYNVEKKELNIEMNVVFYFSNN